MNFTWLSKRPASLTSKTSNTQDLRSVTWSSWCRHLKPGISFAKVHTCRTWSMKRSLNCSINESSGRPFMGQVCKKERKNQIKIRSIVGNFFSNQKFARISLIFSKTFWQVWLKSGQFYLGNLGDIFVFLMCGINYTVVIATSFRNVL